MTEDRGITPDRLDLVLNKSQGFIAAQRFDLAAKTLRKGLGDFPEEGEIHSMLALALSQLGDDQGAEEAARNALRLDPEDPVAYMALSRVAITQGMFHQAEKYLLGGLSLGVENPFLLTEYGRVMLLTGHGRKAGLLLERALEVDPQYTEALSLMELNQAKLPNKKKTLRELSQSLEAMPNVALIHYRVAHIALQTGHPFKARDHFREALRLDPNLARAEELYLQTDGVCRWIGLPQYYWSLLVNRIPGESYTVLACLLIGLGLVFEARGVRTWGTLPLAVVIGFMACVTGGQFLVRLWTRWRPPR